MFCDPEIKTVCVTPARSKALEIMDRRRGSQYMTSKGEEKATTYMTKNSFSPPQKSPLKVDQNSYTHHVTTATQRT